MNDPLKIESLIELTDKECERLRIEWEEVYLQPVKYVPIMLALVPDIEEFLRKEQEDDLS